LFSRIYLKTRPTEKLFTVSCRNAPAKALLKIVCVITNIGRYGPTARDLFLMGKSPLEHGITFPNVSSV